MRYMNVFSTAAVLAVGSVATAGGVEMYATNHMGLYPDLGSDTLVRFDSDDPANYTTIGTINVDGISFGGLAFDSDGTLWTYASFNQFGGAATGLYSVDTDTAEATLQGTQSMQPLTDLAWNPVDETMYGVFSQGYSVGRLYSVNLTTGAVVEVGTFSGLDSQNNLVGLAIDSDGTFYVYDNMNMKLYKSGSDLNLTLLYTEADIQCNQCGNAAGSQGIAIDWSRDDAGYHGAVGQGVFPNYYNNINSFALDGSSYVWGPDFGPNYPDGLAQVQPGDIAIVPGDPEPHTPGDLNGDGSVNVSDMLMLLGNWGQCPKGSCDADLNDDGQVNVSDLLLLLGNWT